ncbi:hypothetical protein [Arthrobacter mobilis]|uniref:Uncharacterized protein n=1 Tax=Arthrobacter mobilis TaxID=2724944 RepID=A0A7X6QM46_9MICC|nr:hypothetical protein [Arthrobacter mobilis]NKX56359.1 hypothetical protein [Arthrobacter mobilis]
MVITRQRQEITAASNEEADQLLNAVVEDLQQLARREGRYGILVTKTGPGRFTVELSEDVPFGVTEETTG